MIDLVHFIKEKWGWWLRLVTMSHNIWKRALAQFTPGPAIVFYPPTAIAIHTDKLHAQMVCMHCSLQA